MSKHIPITIPAKVEARSEISIDGGKTYEAGEWIMGPVTFDIVTDFITDFRISVRKLNE